jgi:hypothetical protein
MASPRGSPKKTWNDRAAGTQGGGRRWHLARCGDPLPLTADYALDRVEAIALGTVTS